MTLRASAGNWLNNESSAGVETKTTQSNSEATTDVVTRSSGGDADDILQSDASSVCLFYVNYRILGSKWKTDGKNEDY